MTTKYIVFDIDGTLIDTKTAFLGALQTALDRRCIRHGDITKYFSLPLADAVLDFSMDAETVADWEADYAARLSRAPLYPGVKDMILALSGSVRMALVTSRKHNVAHLGLDTAGLLDRFEMIIAADDVEHPKPNAEPLEKFRAYVGCQKEEMLFIGDSDVDLACARNAGVPFLAPGWATVPDELLPFRASTADVIARTEPRL